MKMATHPRFVPSDELGLKPRVGLAKISKMGFDGVDLNPLWASLLTRLKADTTDAEAAMDLSLIAQLLGDQPTGFQLQELAINTKRLFRNPCVTSDPALRVLVFSAPSDMGGNVPIEFLLEDSDVEMHTVYVVPGQSLPEPLPQHDIAFVAIPDSDATFAALKEMEGHAQYWPRPVLNKPDAIQNLDRDRLCRLLTDVPNLVIPETVRADRVYLKDISTGIATIDELLSDGDFPLVIRPVGSQAGRGLARLESAADIEPYLADRSEDEFFLSTFVNYSGDDGQFRKYRVIFIEGRPYACHMAIGNEWKLWYLNAAMDGSPAKRQEEENFMRKFDTEFAARHAGALKEIASRIKLDYFGIDCAEADDGRLLIFEADVAMIVHDMDPPEVFPYKRPQMQKIFGAFRAMLHSRALTASAKAA